MNNQANQTSKMGQARQSFVKMVRNKAEMEAHAMALFINPNATPKQIVEARALLLGITKPLSNAVTTLRNKYPYQGVSNSPRPWHRGEFNMYDQGNPQQGEQA